VQGAYSGGCGRQAWAVLVAGGAWVGAPAGQGAYSGGCGAHGVAAAVAVRVAVAVVVAVG
jgi:hypothetical protein